MVSSVTKATAERHQRILLELLKQPGNEVCADCRTRNPRWASWNLGIFICVKCAGIHRKLGTHITKVKSLTLDSWTKEQVQCMKQFGNIKSNQIFNPNDAKNPPPTELEESERDGQLEKHIRMKYESKRFIGPPRRNESIGSCSASVSSGVSFTMSNSPTHSPASSIYQQPAKKSLPLPFRSSSMTATSRAESQPPRSQEISSTRRPSDWSMPSKTASLESSQPRTHFDPASSGIPKSTEESQSPAPPLRPSTAPISSDVPTNLQSVPPLPVMSSLFHGSGNNTFQTNQIRKQESLTVSSQPHVQPSLSILSSPNQHVQNIHHVPLTSVRRDGVWGDLMQLTEPTHLNANATLSGSHVGSPIKLNLNSNLSNSSTNPYQQSLHSSNKMNNLDVRMEKLNNNNQIDSVSNQVRFFNQGLGVNNPFFNQVQHVHPSSGTFQPFPSLQPANNPNPFVGPSAPSYQPANPFINLSLSTSSNFNPNLSPSLSRNPFHNSNLNTSSSTTLDPFGNHFPTSSSTPHHSSQPATWPINHHPTPFF